MRSVAPSAPAPLAALCDRMLTADIRLRPERLGPLIEALTPARGAASAASSSAV